MFDIFENPTVDKLLSLKEDQYFDRKGSRFDWQNTGNLIIGFANAEGGVLALGIESDKTITGIADTSLKIAEIRKGTTTWITPPLSIKTNLVPCLNHKNETSNILLVSVASSIEVHANSKDEAYLRIGDENKKLNYDERSLLLDEKGKTIFEKSTAAGATLNDLDLELINEFKKILNVEHLSTEETLIARDLATMNGKGDIAINTAGVLLFAKNPTRWVERARIRILRYEGTSEKTGERFNVTKDIYIDGPLPKQAKLTYQSLESTLRDFTTLDSSGKFITNREYPEFALNEAIVNALVHRSYALRGTDIQIKMFDDHLDIESPGGFPAFVNENNIKDTHYSRNPRIARVMTDFGFVRELGEGINRMIEEFKIAKLPNPQITGKPTIHVKVHFENNIRLRQLRREFDINKTLDPEVLRRLNDQEKRIVDFIVEHGKISTKEAENLLQKHRSTIIRYLNNMTDSKILLRQGSKGPKVYYELGEKLTTKVVKKSPKKNGLGDQQSLF